MGMNVAVNWQDQDSSSSNAIKEVFSEAEIMLCKGHVGRSHLKQLENYKKMKRFSKDMRDKHREIITEDVQCCCKDRHSKNCGCLSDCFIVWVRNQMSHIIPTSTSAKEFAQRV